MDTQDTEQFAQFAQEFLLTTEEEPTNLNGGGFFDWLFERPNAVIFFKRKTFERIEDPGIKFTINKRLNTLLYKASTTEEREKLVKDNKDVPIDKFSLYNYFLDENGYHMRVGDTTAELIKTEKAVIAAKPTKDKNLSGQALINYKGLSTVGKLDFLSTAINNLIISPENQDLLRIGPGVHNELAKAKGIIENIKDKIDQHGGNYTVLTGGYISTISFGELKLESKHLDKRWMDLFINIVNNQNNISNDNPDAFNAILVLKEDGDAVKILDLFLYP